MKLYAWGEWKGSVIVKVNEDVILKWNPNSDMNSRYDTILGYYYLYITKTWL